MTVTLEATYRVVTPMFCGGANHQPELRLPSFKGVLRYWWRAWYWSRCGGDLGLLKKAEDYIFGSASGGQSRVSLQWKLEPSRLRETKVGQVLKDSGNGKVIGLGARYLGYGVMEAFASSKKNTEDGQLTRACLVSAASESSEMTIVLRCRELDAEQEASLATALKLVGLLGGIGAKNRKGYGSLALSSLKMNGHEGWSLPKTVSDFATVLRETIADGSVKDDHLPITAFSKDSRFIVVPAQSPVSSLKMLDLVGREMVRYRSYGKNGRILRNVDSERNFQDDHDVMRKGTLDKVPLRTAFGLPHNYGKRLIEQVGPADGNLDRRSSPLFIHIHPLGNDFIAVLAFLPAEFLPAGSGKISVGGVNHEPVEEKEFYQPIRAFLNRLVSGRGRKETFGDVLEVEL